MKNSIIILLMLFSFSVSVSAQVVDRTKDKAKNKTNNRIDNKIDRGLDKGLDSIEGLFKKKNKKDKAEPEESQTQAETEVPGMSMGSAAEVKENYTFDHEIAYKMTSIEKKGKSVEEMTMNMLLSEDKAIFGTLVNSSEGDASVVYDFDNKQMITLTKASGMSLGIVMNIDPDSYDYSVETDESKMSSASFKKSGKTKDILGYACEEWVMEDEEMSGSYWVTDEVDINIGDAFGAVAANQKQGPMSGGEYPEGSMLEMTTIDKNSGDRMEMVATKVEMNSKPKVSTAGYQFMNMGGK